MSEPIRTQLVTNCIATTLPKLHGAIVLDNVHAANIYARSLWQWGRELVGLQILTAKSIPAEVCQ